ncbi:MAG: hypothetical protein QW835_02610 [Candidatus Hadarchaeum sp.]
MADVEIEPILDHEIRRVSPAIDIIEDKAAIGVWLPCRITTVRRDGEYVEDLNYHPFYVTEDRKLVSFYELPPGYVLSCKPIQMEPRWAVKHIKRYLNGEGFPDPVDVFFSVLDAWAEYVEFSDPREYIFRALWDIGTYFAHLFRTYIYDYVGGVKQTGKTKVLMLHAAICHNAILSGNMSTSSIFRLIQHARSTLLIDETEMLASRTDPERTLDFRSLLLFGYKAGNCVYRIEKDVKSERLVPQRYEVYGPKALANIRGLEDVLVDRCKITIMSRALGAAGKKEIDLEDSRWQDLRDKLYRFYLGYWKEVKQTYDEVSELSSLNVQDELTIGKYAYRETELWLPILSLAKFFERRLLNLVNIEKERGVYGELKDIHPHAYNNIICSSCTFQALSSLVLDLARTNVQIKQTEDVTETGEYVLVQTLLDLVKEAKFYRVMNIREQMACSYDEPQSWLTTKWVGNALRRLGFLEKRRVGTGYEYLLTPQGVKNVALRLNIQPQSEPAPSNQFSVLFLEDYPGGLVPGLEGSVPKGTMLILDAPVALELKRSFGFVELKPLEAGPRMQPEEKA